MNPNPSNTSGVYYWNLAVSPGDNSGMRFTVAPGSGQGLSYGAVRQPIPVRYEVPMAAAGSILQSTVAPGMLRLAVPAASYPVSGAPVTVPSGHVRGSVSGATYGLGAPVVSSWHSNPAVVGGQDQQVLPVTHTNTVSIAHYFPFSDLFDLTVSNIKRCGSICFNKINFHSTCKIL